MIKKDSIIVHCTDTPHTMFVTVADLHKWHVIENDWSAIGYAYYIDQIGIIHKCRDLNGDGDVEDDIGAHAHGFNTNSIGICMEGRGEYTENQWGSLRYLINDIISRKGIKLENIIGHRDVDPHKTCPMFDVQDKLQEWMV